MFTMDGKGEELLVVLHVSNISNQYVPLSHVPTAEATETETELLDYEVLNRGVQNVALSDALPLVQKVRIVQHHCLTDS